MKNNNIISLNQWKKHNQTCETLKKPVNLKAETSKGKFIMCTEIEENFSIEFEEDLLSGIIIW